MTNKKEQMKLNVLIKKHKQCSDKTKCEVCFLLRIIESYEDLIDYYEAKIRDIEEADDEEREFYEIRSLL